MKQNFQTKFILEAVKSMYISLPYTIHDHVIKNNIDFIGRNVISICVYITASHKPNVHRDSF